MPDGLIRDDCVYVPEDALRAFSNDLLRQMDVPLDLAEHVTSSLLYSDKRGVHTHGIWRLPSYIEQIRRGELDPKAHPHLDQMKGSLALVDAQLGFGAPAGVFGASLATETAREYGVGAAIVRNAGHFGAAAFYAELIAAEKCVGVVLTNTPAVMAPFGGRESLLGNNPLAIAAPGGGGRPLMVLDIAQSASARGKIKLAEVRGQSIPDDWALDADGRRTTDPTAAIDGALLPSGHHKGSGLSVAIELLTSVLVGGLPAFDLVNTGLTARPGDLNGSRHGHQGVTNLYLAISADCVTGFDDYVKAAESFTSRIRSCMPAEGFKRVLVPGDLEREAEADSARRGVPVDAATYQSLTNLAAELSVPTPRMNPAQVSENQH